MHRALGFQVIMSEPRSSMFERFKTLFNLELFTHNEYLFTEDGSMTLLLKLLICAGSLIAGAGTCYYCSIKKLFKKGETLEQVAKDLYKRPKQEDIIARDMVFTQKRPVKNAVQQS